MELIYAWVEKFRNYNEVELNFSERFIIKYDKYNKNIKIAPNKSYIAISPDFITNINAIVGKNGVGKTNLLDVIGLRSNDRNRNNAEFEVRYKKKKIAYRIPNDIEAEIKHSIYFFIYYMGKDDNDQDLFCFEGNDIESFLSIIKFEPGLSIDYWKSKYWFAYICNYTEGMLVHMYDLNERISEINIDGQKNYKIERNKHVIISLRENLNDKYYDYNSTKPEDDYKISVPRRTAIFQSRLLAMKVQMLYKQMQNSKRLMFLNDKYSLKISYNSYFLTDGIDDDNKLVMQYSYNELDGIEKAVCRVLESFVQYFFNSIKNIENIEMIEKNIEVQLSEINIKVRSLKGYKDYYYKIIKKISDSYLIDGTQHILECYTALADVLSMSKSIEFHENYISLDITRQVNIKELLHVIDVTIDEKTKSNFNEITSAFAGFFDYSIENLSDGETAYLGFFASLYEQISILTPSKENYIILLDEPEARMHPELTRNFMNELLLFLRDLSEEKKKFQVIISTHSPFILSDIQSDNIIYLEKDNMGYCKPVKKVLNTFGANIHTLLKDGFFMSSTIGEFSNRKIKEVISSINDSNIEDVTEEQKNVWLYIINSIGEPLIQNRIMKMFNDKFLLNYTDLFNENLKLKGKLKKYEEPRKISETIEVLMKQIEKLQIHVNELEGKKNDKD